MREVIDYFHGSNRHAMSISAIRHDDGKCTFQHSVGRWHLAAPFFVNHLAFLIYLFSVEQQTIGPTLYNQQTGILYACSCGRYIGHAISGFVQVGNGIQVHTELYTYRFQPFYQCVSGEMFGAIEAHVF